MQVSITGIPELNNALQKLGPEVLRAADRGLQSAGMNIIADAQETLKQEHINTTGLLSSSGRVVRTKEAGGGYDVGFMSGEKNYAGAVEYGRRAGRMPPPDMLDAWAYKKFHLKDRKASRAIGWAMAIHIGRHGTRPHPFFGPAVKKNQSRILSAVRDAITQVINRTGNV